MITIAETGPFRKKLENLLSTHEKDNLITYLAEHPTAGVLIQGTGGIRKLRWAKGGRGKSAGVRIIYYFHNEQMPLYLLASFAKNEQTDLSMEEKNALSKAVQTLTDHWRKHNEQRIH